MEGPILVAVVASTAIVLLLATVSFIGSFSLWRHLRGKPGGELAHVMMVSQGAYVVSQLVIVWIAVSIAARAPVEDAVFYAMYTASQVIIVINSLYAWRRVQSWRKKG